MKSPLLHAQAALTVIAGATRARLETLRQEAKSDRGEGPISTVVIIVAAVAGAVLIAGGLALAYSRANGKLSGILGG
ncbi:hypothetical protein [Streptomyces sp. NPDC056144]|uniref:hypothetical protein n=1 Tax=unclassified Streptomyces TaxID=2593676 RepID=UPI0035D7CDA8